MNKNNNYFFWIVALLSVAAALYRSVISLVQSPSPLFITFTVINVLALVIDIVCFAIDIKKNKNR